MANVNAKKDIIGMELCVCSVLMDSTGTKVLKSVYVQEKLFGMEIFAKKIFSVLVVENIMKNMNNVSADKTNTGMELLVWRPLNVVVGNYGMKQFSNVSVHLTLTGMVIVVFYAKMVKIGIKTLEAVFALQEPNGMDNFVQLFSIALVV